MLKDARTALKANDKYKELTDKFKLFVSSWDEYVLSDESTFPVFGIDRFDSERLKSLFLLYGHELSLRFNLYKEADSFKGAIEVVNLDDKIIYRNLFDTLGNIYLETNKLQGLDWSITDEKYCQFYLGQMATHLLETMVRTEINFEAE